MNIKPKQKESVFTVCSTIHCSAAAKKWFVMSLNTQNMSLNTQITCVCISKGITISRSTTTRLLVPQSIMRCSGGGAVYDAMVLSVLGPLFPSFCWRMNQCEFERMMNGRCYYACTYWDAWVESDSVLCNRLVVLINTSFISSPYVHCL